jgi:hypothetical protein
MEQVLVGKEPCCSGNDIGSVSIDGIDGTAYDFARSSTYHAPLYVGAVHHLGV